MSIVWPFSPNSPTYPQRRRWTTEFILRVLLLLTGHCTERWIFASSSRDRVYQTKGVTQGTFGSAPDPKPWHKSYADPRRGPRACGLAHTRRGLCRARGWGQNGSVSRHSARDGISVKLQNTQRVLFIRQESPMADDIRARIDQLNQGINPGEKAQQQLPLQQQQPRQASVAGKSNGMLCRMSGPAPWTHRFTCEPGTSASLNASNVSYSRTTKDSIVPATRIGACTTSCTMAASGARSTPAVAGPIFRVVRNVVSSTS